MRNVISDATSGREIARRLTALCGQEDEVGQFGGKIWEETRDSGHESYIAKNYILWATFRLCRRQYVSNFSHRWPSKLPMSVRRHQIAFNYAVQGHSKSPILVQMDSPYAVLIST